MYIPKALLAAATLCGAAFGSPLPATQQNHTMPMKSSEAIVGRANMDTASFRPPKPEIKCLVPDYAASDYGLVRVLIKNIGENEAGFKLGPHECKQVACVRDEAAIYICSRVAHEVTVPAYQAQQAASTVRGYCQDTASGKHYAQGRYVNHEDAWDLTVGRKETGGGHQESCRSELNHGF